MLRLRKSVSLSSQFTTTARYKLDSNQWNIRRQILNVSSTCYAGFVKAGQDYFAQQAISEQLIPLHG